MTAPSLVTMGLPATSSALLRRALGRAPDALAVADRRRRLTYRELDAEIGSAAAWLRGIGVEPGSAVAATMANHADLVVLFLAVMRVGGIWVGLNRVLAPSEKAFILGDARVRLVVAEGSLADEIRALEAELRDLDAVVGVEPSAADVPWRAIPRLATGASATEPAIGPATADRDPFEPALISYTSGTTGKPKGVVHSEHNLLLPGASLSEGPEFGQGARLGVCLPLTIANMLVIGPLMAFQTEASCVVTDPCRPPELAAWVKGEGVESMTLVPTMLFDLVEDTSVDLADLVTLTRIQTGGAPWSPALIERFTDRFGTRPVGTFGLTEAPTCVALEPRDRQMAAGASGHPNAHLRVVIVDRDLRPLPAGEVGEICIAPATAGRWADVYRPMLGYHERPDATAEALAGGLVHTGDVGFLDGAGDLHVAGRRSELILRGGANVAPAEVELVLDEHPAVRASAVVGVPDDRLGEVPVAVVEVEGGVADEELGAHCASRLARYKQPVGFVRVEALPRNSMGKVVRGDVRRIATGDVDR